MRIYISFLLTYTGSQLLKSPSVVRSVGCIDLGVISLPACSHMSHPAGLVVVEPALEVLGGWENETESVSGGMSRKQGQATLILRIGQNASGDSLFISSGESEVNWRARANMEIAGAGNSCDTTVILRYSLGLTLIITVK
eukprot:727504-Hanusia_phi.AAC.3